MAKNGKNRRTTKRNTNGGNVEPASLSAAAVRLSEEVPDDLPELEEQTEEDVESNQHKEEIKQALERDNFMTPENAKDFGLIDKVVEKRS